MRCVFVLLVLTCCSRAKALEIVPTRLIFAVLLVQVEARRKKKEAEKAASASDGKRRRRSMLAQLQRATRSSMTVCMSQVGGCSAQWHRDPIVHRVPAHRVPARSHHPVRTTLPSKSLSNFVFRETWCGLKQYVESQYWPMSNITLLYDHESIRHPRLGLRASHSIGNHYARARSSRRTVA
jgi:hypothetical protein